MNITEALEKEFSKDVLSKVNLHLLIKTILEDEIKNYKSEEDFNAFLRKSEFVNFFKQENFKNGLYRLDEDSGLVCSDTFWSEIKNGSESLSISYGRGANHNPLAIVYTKIIDDIEIVKHFLLERNQNDKIDSFFVSVHACDVIDEQQYERKYNSYLNYRFSFDEKTKKLKLTNSNQKNNFFEEISIKTQKNNYIEESYFEMSELICDFNNGVKKTLMEFFNAENFDNVDYFKETHNLLDFIIEKFEK